MRRAAALTILLAVPFGVAQLPLDPEDEAKLPAAVDEPLSEDTLTHLHKLLDENKDGLLSREEAKRVSDQWRKKWQEKDLKELLEHWDHDGDGRLEEEQLMKEHEAPQDLEGEDYLSPEERKKHLQSLKEEERYNRAKFKAADQDGDGHLSGEEIVNFFHEQGPDVQEVVTGHGFRNIDRNNDGKLEMKELFGQLIDDEEHPEVKQNEEVDPQDLEDFRKMDTDQDGFLTQEEYSVWHTGEYHSNKGFSALFDAADPENKGHITLEDLIKVRHDIHGTDAQYHMMEWLDNYDAHAHDGAEL
eukprot:TRINITY_DN38632_c0_g1_i1.p1 TRINITY_DN38632_c0_g1~~TRINITY_DN38632_c0_g1_i1.p1  ORF type:complete len:341 (+),score=85.29 TRINITY_DN38632_c0_g1_i1:123-1025(+)